MKKILLSLIFFFACIFSVQAQTLYGTTTNGGSYGGGTLIRFQPAANNLTVAKSFESFSPEAYNSSFLQATDGKLYGVSTGFGGGGWHANGLIFSFDPSTFTYTSLKFFDSIPNGNSPCGSLVQATNGKFYGMTSSGGSMNVGVIFSFDPSSYIYTKLIDFDTANGAYPSGSLIQASDGKLYGMTYQGGSSNLGVIFSFEPSSSAYTKLKDFENISGAYPSGSSLMQASNGKLYGMTFNGGSNGVGVIFSFDPSTSTYTKLKDLDISNGSGPHGSLIQASNGKLYGMTQWGGSNNDGVIFSLDPASSAYTKLMDFNNTRGYYPLGSLVQASNGKLYGMTYEGGGNDYGVIFSFDIFSSNYTKLKDFNDADGAYPVGNLMQANNGKFYGRSGPGLNSNTDAGFIFSVDPSSSVYTTLKDFYFGSGRHPYGTIIQATDGKFYGMTNDGGSSNKGVIYSFDPISSTYTKLKDFDGTNGAFPNGSLIEASDGKLYGMTQIGGSSDVGIIFSFDPSNSSYVKLKDFDNTDGSGPIGSLIQASDGKLYGTTVSGGSIGNGVIFSLDPISSTYTKLKDFVGSDGAFPNGSLIEASDGKLYGMTNSGGSNYGVIFSFDPSTSTYTKLKDFDNLTGINPYGSLIQAANGKLYGMTYEGGSSNAGVIFSFDPLNSTYTKLMDFNWTDGAYPTGSLVQASDGKLYGMTWWGGSNYSDHGVIFSIDISTSAYTKLKDFDGTNGANPYYGSAFIEVNGTLAVTLIRFTGKNNGTSNQLSWKVENEFDLNYYELQRGIDGQHFTGISQIKATRNNSYTYNDTIATVVSSKYYYRLKSVDKDGKFTYSNIIRIDFDKPYSLSVSPVPAHDVVTITGAENFTSVQFIDASGRIVKQFGKMPNNLFPVADLNKGIYFIRLVSASDTRIFKIIKE